MIAFVLCLLLYIVDKVTYIVVKHGDSREEIQKRRALLVFPQKIPRRQTTGYQRDTAV